MTPESSFSPLVQCCSSNQEKLCLWWRKEGQVIFVWYVQKERKPSMGTLKNRWRKSCNKSDCKGWFYMFWYSIHPKQHKMHSLLLFYAGVIKYLPSLGCPEAAGVGWRGMIKSSHKCLNWWKECWKHNIPNLHRAQYTLGFSSYKSVQSITSAGAHGPPPPFTFPLHIDNYTATQSSPGSKDEGSTHLSLCAFYSRHLANRWEVYCWMASNWDECNHHHPCPL